MTSKVANGRPSLADVAKQAGVSSQTVSRVVRGADVVAKGTREKVMAVVAELGYQPNLAARSLSQRRTGVVHVVNATPLFHGHARTFLEVVGAVGELGLHTSMSVVPFGEDLTLNRLIPMGVDGVVILGGHSRSRYWAEMAESRVPVVFVGQRLGLPESVSSVGIDQAHGALLATRHLVEAGCHRLLHICGPSDWLDAEDRRDGFVTACDEACISYEKLSSPTWDAQSAYELTAAMPPGINGVFASNDHLALGVMRRLHERDVAIPEEVSVVGFDDAEGSNCFWPPLSTVRQPFAELGHAAVGQLTRLIDDGSPEHSLIRPELIVRGSSKGHQ